MTAAVRYLEKFQNSAGTVTYTFPVRAYEWDSVETLRTAFLESAGMDFAYDALRSADAPRNVASETVRFIILKADAPTVDTEVDTMKSTLYTIGQGQLFTLDSNGVRRWCWARIIAMPDVKITVPAQVHVPVVLQFQRFSPWFASSITTVTTAVSATPTAFTVTNPGNIPAKLVLVRFRSNSSTGLHHPALTNGTNGYSFSSTRDGTTANSEVKVDSNDLSVKYSNDDGASYADDFANFTLGQNQANFMRLEPGNNAMTYTDTGTPNLSLEVTFYAPYA